MEALGLLGAVDTAFQIIEKIIWFGICAWILITGFRYYKDYKESIEEEK